MSQQEFEKLFGLLNLVVLFALLTTAAATDVAKRKIYNWTTFPAIGLGLALGYLAGGLGSFPLLTTPASGLLDRVAGFLLGFGVFAVFSVARAVGPGDVKLMAAVGALTGARFTVWAMFWGALIGAILAVWALLLRGQLLRGLGRSFLRTLRVGRDDPKDADPEQAPEKVRIPYGVALSFGTILAWFLNPPS